jgi:hypothetical protein
MGVENQSLEVCALGSLEGISSGRKLKLDSKLSSPPWPFGAASSNGILKRVPGSRVKTSKKSLDLYQLKDLL